MFFDNVHILLWMYKLCVLNIHKSSCETGLLPEKLYSRLSQHKDLKTSSKIIYNWLQDNLSTILYDVTYCLCILNTILHVTPHHISVISLIMTAVGTPSVLSIFWIKSLGLFTKNPKYLKYPQIMISMSKC
jgi:hypothetical protein